MNYQNYLQKALRLAVYDILSTVAKKGIEPGCAYYLTFETNRNDVRLPAFIRARYPSEITLVLENQFKNLSVSKSKITVDLSFGGVFSTVYIPLRALKQFSDPYHEFVLTLIPQPVQKYNRTASKIIRLDDLRKGNR